MYTCAIIGPRDECNNSLIQSILDKFLDEDASNIAEIYVFDYSLFDYFVYNYLSKKNVKITKIECDKSYLPAEQEVKMCSKVDIVYIFQNKSLDHVYSEFFNFRNNKIKNKKKFFDI